MKYFQADEIRAALKPRELQIALASHLVNEHQNSPRQVLAVSKSKALGSMLAMSGDLIGGKMVCVFPHNEELNPHQGLVILFCPTTGKPTAIFEASEITAIRTATLSMLATDVLSSKTIKDLVIYGTGVQAYLHAKYIAKIRPIERIFVIGRNSQKVDLLMSRLNSELNIPVQTGQSQFERPAIFCLCTASMETYLREEEVPLGSHLNAVGACRPGMREILLLPITRLKVYVDDPFRIDEESSELKNQALNLLSSKLKKKDKTTFSEQTTLFKSVGTGLLDIVAANLVREKLCPR